MARSILVVSIDKQRDEITLTGFLFLLSLLHRLHESRIGLVVGQNLYHVGYRDFEDNIHTALEVEAEADLSLKAFLVRVDTQILHRILIVLLCYRVFDLCCLRIKVAGGCRETQVEDACERQKDGYANYDTFVLHFICYVI